MALDPVNYYRITEAVSRGRKKSEAL